MLTPATYSLNNENLKAPSLERDRSFLFEVEFDFRNEAKRSELICILYSLPVIKYCLSCYKKITLVHLKLSCNVLLQQYESEMV